MTNELTPIYIVPDSEAIVQDCAPCGSFVRREQPPRYAASESGKIRILELGKEASSRTDKHVSYLKESGGVCPAISQHIMSALNIRPFITATEFIVRFFTDINLAADMIANPTDYDVVFDGVLNNYKNTSVDFHVWSDYASPEISEFFINFGDTGDWKPEWTDGSYFYFNEPSSLDSVTHTLEVRHLGNPHSSITFTATRATPGAVNSEVFVEMTNITGSMFGAVTDDTEFGDTPPGYSREVFTCP